MFGCLLDLLNTQHLNQSGLVNNINNAVELSQLEQAEIILTQNRIYFLAVYLSLNIFW